MNWVQIVLGALVGEPPDIVSAKRHRFVVIGVLLTIVSLGLIGTCWLILQIGIYGWQTSDWERLGPALFLPWPFLFTLLFLPVLLAAPQIIPRGFTTPLRDLVASGDMRVSFPVALQPPPLMPQEAAAGPQTFQKLRIEEGSQRRRYYFPSVPGMLIQYVFALEHLPEALGLPNAFVGSPWFDWLFSLLFFVTLLACIVPVVALIRSFVGPRVRLHITATEQGLTWRRGKRGGEEHLAWTAVRSFSVVICQDAYGMSSRTAFLVDGGDALLAWALYSGSRTDEYGESWQLARHIVTRSHQLLRDLAPLGEALVWTKAKPDRLRAIGAPEPLIEGIAAARRQRRRYITALVPLLIGLFAYVFVSLFAQSYAQHYQQHYFANLIARIHAEKPLYHDPLSQENDDWHEQVPSSNDQSSYTFRDGAYHLKDSEGHAIAVWKDVIGYLDAAVEVTAHQLSSGQDDGVGLTLRVSNEGYDQIAFSVSPAGYWALEHYRYVDGTSEHDWTRLLYGYIIPDPSPSHSDHRLLIVMRGSLFLCYVDGTFVGSYHDRQGVLPQGGFIGVFVANGATEGVFRDFTIYPIKSPPALDYV